MEEVLNVPNGTKHKLFKTFLSTAICGTFAISSFQIYKKYQEYKNGFSKQITFKVLRDYKLNINEVKFNSVDRASIADVKVDTIKVRNSRKIKVIKLVKNKIKKLDSVPLREIKISAISKPAESFYERQVHSLIKNNFFTFVKETKEAIDLGDKIKLKNILANELNNEKTKYDIELDKPYVKPVTIQSGLKQKDIAKIYKSLNGLIALKEQYKNKPEMIVKKDTQTTALSSLTTKNSQTISAIKKEYSVNNEPKQVNVPAKIDFVAEMQQTRQKDIENGVFQNTPETPITEADNIPAINNKRYALDMNPMKIIAGSNGLARENEYQTDENIQKEYPSANENKKNTQDIQINNDTQANQNIIGIQGINQPLVKNSGLATSNKGAFGSNIKDYQMVYETEKNKETKKIVQNESNDKQLDKQKENTFAASFQNDEDKAPTIAELIEKYKNENSQNNNNTTQTQPDKSFENIYGGIVYEAFTGHKTKIENAKIQILGAELTATSDENGEFKFSDKVEIQGVLPVLITKEGHLNRRADLQIGKASEIELVSENSATLSAVVINEKRNENSGYIFGELAAPIGSESSVAEMRIELSGNEYVNVIYINEAGIPDKNLKTTSKRGQFLALNLKAATYLMNVIDRQGIERAPHIIHVGNDEGIIRKFNLGTQVTFSGQIVNANKENAKVDQAMVQILGLSNMVQTDKDGRYEFKNVYVDCTENNYLQMDKSGFYRNRFNLNCKQFNNKHYAFPAAQIDSISTETQVKLESAKAVLQGHVSFNKSVKVQLWGPDEVLANSATRGEDYYFDQDGVINASKNRTSSNGNFVIINAPSGISYVQTISKNGKTLSFWPIFLSESTVSVYIQ